MAPKLYHEEFQNLFPSSWASSTPPMAWTAMNATMTTTTKSGRGFTSGFVASLSAILVSELGDKTFFIAALMAMRNGRLTIFLGALAALATMTLLSACGGKLVTLIIPRDYTFYISATLFLIFGLKMLHEGYMMTPEEANEEMEEVQQELAQQQQLPKNENQQQLSLIRSAEVSPTTNSENHNNNVDSEAHRNDEETNDLPKTRNESLSHSPSDGPPTPSSPGPSPSSPFIILHTPADSSSSSSSPPTSSSSSSSPSYLASLGRRLPSPSDFCDGLKNNLCSFFRRRILVSAMGVPLSHAFVQACTLTFLAEWGDRSQMATIALASGENVFGVIVGGVLGHAICTGTAVIGGRLLASKISVRHVTLLGGIIFIIFAFVAIGVGPDEEG